MLSEFVWKFNIDRKFLKLWYCQKVFKLCCWQKDWNLHNDRKFWRLTLDWIMSRSNRRWGAQKLSVRAWILKNFLAIRLPDCRTFCTYVSPSPQHKIGLGIVSCVWLLCQNYSCEPFTGNCAKIYHNYILKFQILKKGKIKVMI